MNMSLWSRATKIKMKFYYSHKWVLERLRHYLHLHLVAKTIFRRTISLVQQCELMWVRYGLEQKN